MANEEKVTLEYLSHVLHPQIISYIKGKFVTCILVLLILGCMLMSYSVETKARSGL